MKKSKKELVEARLKKSEEALNMAVFAAEKKYWNSSASALYYSCFYLVHALFAEYEIDAHTHSGTKTLFGSEFIKQNIIEERWGKLLSHLFKYRQDADYGDFPIIKESNIVPLISEIKEFDTIVRHLLAQKK
jgi:uncharacterized protein (UPF0332 family)